MGFDLFQSRRNMNEFCEWWSELKNDDDSEDKLIYSRIPNGCFFAKEVNAEAQDDNFIAGIFALDKTSLTIMSSDDLTGLYNSSQDISNRVLVKYQGELWRVDNVQKRKARIQNSEFAKSSEVSHYWYLSLIKG